MARLLVALAAVAQAYVAVPRCRSSSANAFKPRRTAVFAEVAAPPEVDPFEVTISGLKYKDLERGEGEPPQKGDLVLVDYDGYLVKGDFKFDSSTTRGEPYAFEIGNGKVIPGWDEGVSTMRVGGKRTLVIPARLAYGDRNIGGGLIPPNSDLRFEVVLREIKSGPIAKAAFGLQQQASVATGAFGLNPFTFFTVALITLTVAPYFLDKNSALMQPGLPDLSNLGGGGGN